MHASVRHQRVRMFTIRNLVRTFMESSTYRCGLEGDGTQLTRLPGVGRAILIFGKCPFLTNPPLYKLLLDPMNAVLVILLIWLWQRQAFTMLVPHSGLTYAYFLTSQAAKAGFWTLTCPLRVGLTALTICFVAGLVSAWRAGFHGLLACIIPWWLSEFLIFSLPWMYLDAQENASVFISPATPPGKSANRPSGGSTRVTGKPVYQGLRQMDSATLSTSCLSNAE